VVTKRQSYLVFLFATVISVGYTAAASLLLINEYMDGGWFTLSVLAQKSWPLFWSEYPIRFTVWALVYWPTEMAITLGLEARSAERLYAALYYGLPSASLLACWLLSKRTDTLIWPSSFFLCVTPLTFGFPTESLVMAALFWPLLFAAMASPIAASTIAYFLMLPAFTFTYEAMILCLPVIGFAVWRNRLTNRSVRLYALSSCIIAWLTARLLVLPEETAARLALQASHALWNPTEILRNIAATKLALVLLISIAASAALIARRHRLLILGAAGALLLAVALSHFGAGTYASQRYPARLFVIFLLPIIGLLASTNAETIFQRRLAAQALTLFLTFGVVSLASENIRFAREWSAHRSAMAAFGQKKNGLIELDAVPADSGIRKVLTWDWSLPFLSVVADKQFTPRAVIYNRHAAVSPIGCDHLEQLHSPKLWENEPVPLRDYLCRIVPASGIVVILPSEPRRASPALSSRP
jgi:hypothetical protein